jgi:hypothetical protein
VGPALRGVGPACVRAYEVIENVESIMQTGVGARGAMDQLG